MESVHRCCCGLDVQKQTVVACLRQVGADGRCSKALRTFGAMTEDLLALADWLRVAGCAQVAMESAGVYWKPVYNPLAGQCEVLLANARHSKAVPGRGRGLPAAGPARRLPRRQPERAGVRQAQGAAPARRGADPGGPGGRHRRGPGRHRRRRRPRLVRPPAPTHSPPPRATSPHPDLMVPGRRRLKSPLGGRQA